MRYLVLQSVRLYRHLTSDSLYRNSVYLLINMALTAAAGFAFWAMCARLYPQTEVGYASALFGALGLATSLSNLGMSRTMVRFLAGSKTPATDVVTKLSLVAAGSLVVGVVLGLFLPRFGVRNVTGWVVAVFVAATLLTSIKLLFDNVFIALKSAAGTLIENIGFSIAKLVVPLAAVSLGFLGIFSAQLAGAAVATLVSFWLLRWRHAYRLLVRPTRASLRGKWTFALGSFTSDIIGSLPANLLPIVVLSKLGPVASALWYTSMLMINLLLAISSSINQAMFAEIASAPTAVWHFVRKATFAMYGLVTPLAVAVAVFAPHILKLFGHQYVAGAGTLRIMALFALIGIANYITGSILALYKKVAYLTLVNAINAAIVGLYCLVWATDLRGVAMAWVWGEVANVILFVGGCLYVVKHRSSTVKEDTL